MITLAERAVQMREEIARLEMRAAMSHDRKTRYMLAGRIRTLTLRLGRVEQEVRSGT
jgi:hypothetical protein